MTARFTESTVEEGALAWLESLGRTITHGPNIAPGAERAEYGRGALRQRVRHALAQLDPDLLGGTLEDAFRRLPRREGPTLADPGLPERRVAIEGLIDRRRFLDLVRNLIVLEGEGGGRLANEMAGYDQFHPARQIIARAAVPEGVVDFLAAAGLEKPDISILSEELPGEMRGLPQRDLDVELLQKPPTGELETRRREALVQAGASADMLERSLRRIRSARHVPDKATVKA